MEVPQLTPVTACPQTGGPIRIARYSYDALDNLVCMEQHGKGFPIVNWGISLIVDSSLSTYAPFLGTYVERSFVAQGTPSLVSPQHSAVRWAVCPGPWLRLTRFLVLPNGGNQRRLLRGVVGIPAEVGLRDQTPSILIFGRNSAGIRIRHRQGASARCKYPLADMKSALRGQ